MLIRTRHLLDGSHFVHTAGTRNGYLYGFDFAGHLVVGRDHSVFRQGFDAFCLTYVAEGTGRLVLDGTVHHPAAGQLAFYDLMQPNLFTAADGPLVVESLYVYGPNVRQIYDRFHAEYGNLLSGFDGGRFTRAVRELYSAEAEAWRISEIVYGLLMEVLSYCHEQDGSDVARAVAFIREHFSEDITLEDMAGAAFLSKYYFLRKFRSRTGMTPKEFLEEVRFDRSKQLLENSGMSVEAIAESVGCKDARTLVSLFRERTGVTPSAYRTYLRREKEVERR